MCYVDFNATNVRSHSKMLVTIIQQLPYSGLFLKRIYFWIFHLAFLFENKLCQNIIHNNEAHNYKILVPVYTFTRHHDRGAHHSVTISYNLCSFSTLQSSLKQNLPINFVNFLSASPPRHHMYENHTISRDLED